jgi:hypothetical protein
VVRNTGFWFVWSHIYGQVAKKMQRKHWYTRFMHYVPRLTDVNNGKLRKPSASGGKLPSGKLSSCRNAGGARPWNAGLQRSDLYCRGAERSQRKDVTYTSNVEFKNASSFIYTLESGWGTGWTSPFTFYLFIMCRFSYTDCICRQSFYLWTILN